MTITNERIAELREIAGMCGIGIGGKALTDILDALTESRAEAEGLRAELAALKQGVEVEPAEIDAAWNEYATRYRDMLSDNPEADLEVFSAGFRANARPVPAPPPLPADKVVVPRSAAEYAILAFDWIDCPDPEHYEALRAFYDALRAQPTTNGKGE